MSFPWTTAQTTAVARLGTYNSGAYNSSTNPKGFASGGHIINFIPALQDVATAAQAAADAATYAGAIDAQAIVSGTINATTGHLIFTRSDASTFDVGSVRVAATTFVDFTLSGAVNVARTGEALIQTSDTTAQVVGDNTSLIEWVDGFRGQWTNSAINNDTPHWKFSTGWTVVTGTTLTADSVTAPDGTVTAAKIADTSSTDVGQVNSMLVSGIFGFRSVWLKWDAATPPTAAGMISTDYEAVAGTPITSGANWKRYTLGRNSGGVLNDDEAFRIYPAGAAPGPTLNAAATGAVDAWGAFSSTQAYLQPTAKTALSASVMTLPPLVAAEMINADCIDIEWEYLPPWELANQAFTLWSASSGLHSLRRYIFGSWIHWILRVNGADVLTAMHVDVLTPGTAQMSVRGQIDTVRAWFDLTTGQSGIRHSVGGVLAQDKIGTASGSPIATTNHFYPGSHMGASDFATIRHKRAWARRAGSSRALKPRILALGDSTTAHYAGAPSTTSLILQGAEQENILFRSIAVPGQTITQQAGEWAALSLTERQNAAGVVIQVGLNDLLVLADSAATITGRIQSLIAAIRTDNATCKIIVSQMTPAKQRWIDIFGATDGATTQTKWAAINANIAGTGSNNITGVQDRVTAHPALMSDGPGNLLAAYETYDNDHIHPNWKGRIVNANAIRTKLVAQGLL